VLFHFSFLIQRLREDKIDMAIEIFKLNTRLFPNVANTYDSLGEAYMVKGNKQLAIQCYEKVLEIDPDNESAKSILKKLKEESDPIFPILNTKIAKQDHPKLLLYNKIQE